MGYDLLVVNSTIIRRLIYARLHHEYRFTLFEHVSGLPVPIALGGCTTSSGTSGHVFKTV